MPKKMLILLIMIVFCITTGITSSEAASGFADDFESGNLNNWTVGGRQIGTNIANVVPCGTGSLGGHLYHSSFTEITLHRDFEFDPKVTFHFDLEVDVSSSPPPAPNYYGSSGVIFAFLDSSGTTLGAVRYIAATTNYSFTDGVSKTNAVNQIPENVMQHHAIDVSDMLSQIVIDDTQIANIRMAMKTYSSTYPTPYVSAELWFDNVSTVKADSDPSCVSQKLKVASKLSKSLMSCYSKKMKTSHFDLYACLSTAEEKFESSWDQAEAKAEKKGLDCSTAADTAIADIIFLALENISNQISGVLDLEDKEARKLGQRLMKTVGTYCSDLLKAESTNAKKPDEVKLTVTQNKAYDKFEKSWNKAVDKAGKKGAPYTGPSIHEVTIIIANLVDKISTAMPQPTPSVPDIRGEYTGSYTIDVLNCSESGNYEASVVIDISDQTGNSFRGTAEGTFEDGGSTAIEYILLSGKITATGKISGSTTHTFLGTTGKGTFTGQLDGNTLLITNTGQDTSGSTCNYTRDITATR